jgi:hypothetical protein
MFLDFRIRKWPAYCTPSAAGVFYRITGYPLDEKVFIIFKELLVIRDIHACSPFTFLDKKKAHPRFTHIVVVEPLPEFFGKPLTLNSIKRANET